MKKLFAFLAVAFSLTLGAAPERFSVLRLADGATLTNAAARLGAQIELPQFQDLVGSLIMFSEARGLFGPEREGAPSAYIGYVPAGEGPLSPASLGEQALVALMYPTAQSRAAFREKFPGVDETNGVMRLVSQEDGVSVTNYIAYAEDGRWVAAAPAAELATLALAETNKLEKADLQGNLIDFTLEDNRFVEQCKSGGFQGRGRLQIWIPCGRARFGRPGDACDGERILFGKAWTPKTRWEAACFRR